MLLGWFGTLVHVGYLGWESSSRKSILGGVTVIELACSSSLREYGRGRISRMCIGCSGRGSLTPRILPLLRETQRMARLYPFRRTQVSVPDGVARAGWR